MPKVYFRYVLLEIGMNNYWFEIAIIMSIFAVGNILFGHFEQETPKWRRVTKVFLFTGFAVLLSALFGRAGFYGLLGLSAILILVVHGWWLPKNGIHPLTAEPKDRYYKFRGWKMPDSNQS
jgi:hypothetical protein